MSTSTRVPQVRLWFTNLGLASNRVTNAPSARTRLALFHRVRFTYAMKRQFLTASAILVALLTFLPAAHAQILSDHTASAVSSSLGTSLTFSHTVGTATNRIIVVGVQLRIDSGTGNPGATTRVTGITFNGTALTCLVALADNNSGSCGNSASGTSGFLRSEIWYLLNPTSATANIVVSVNNSTVLGAGSTSYSGVASAATGGSAASNNGITGTATATLGPITTPANGLVVDSLAVPRSTTTVTATGTGHTKLTDVSDTATANFHVRGLVGQDTTANPTVTWSLSPNSPWSIVAAVLTPSPIKRKTQSVIAR